MNLSPTFCPRLYADDTTPYSNGKNIVAVLENIETKGNEVLY